MEPFFLDVSPNSPYLDSLIYLGIVLLILSQITEKITTYIRNYIGVIYPPNGKYIKRKKTKTFLQKTTTWLLAGIAALDNVSDLARNKIQTIAKDEKNKVEFAITKLSILIGFIIAIAFKADLFALIQTDQMPHTLLGWGAIDICPCKLDCWLEFSKVLPGCFATGFLLTFGSKFFHDLLELLYEVKRLRRKIADEYTYRAPDFEAMLQRIASGTDDPVRLVLLQHKDRLLYKYRNITSIARIFKENGNSLLEIRVNDDNLEAIKKYEFNYLENGDLKKLPLDRIRFIEDAGDVLPLGSGNLYVGDWVFNNSTSNNRGTLGFFATQGDALVMVTCYHALRTSRHSWDSLGDLDDSYNKVSGTIALENGKSESREIGILIDGTINHWLDCAVVKLRPDINWWNEDPHGLGIFKVLNTAQVSIKSEVKINGAKSPVGVGIVRALENVVSVNYGSKINSLSDLICIENKDDPSIPLTQKGDSGAVVIDTNGNAVGMVVAGDGMLTYALPISRLMQAFDLT